ncbi:uncharacterized protein LOC111347474 [Stylophora pistillata]|uniref:uncharacterized protein LOC111347474 n=1 Tax=Stylophora pistillata TaxID=50429 RepID=UPI000C04483D|nr:uncharacterized protein LOC111347474 [Stylophora pistillata]
MKKKKAIWIIHSIHGIDNECNLASLLTLLNCATDLVCGPQALKYKYSLPLRPSSDVVLLPCRTKLQFSTTVARQEIFSDSDVESNQIQGIFDVQVSHEVLTICPRNRAEFRIRWRCRKIKCTVPEEVAAHKSATSKADRRVDSSISAYVLKNTGKLVQVGSPICSLCKNYIVKAIQEQQTMTAYISPEIILTPAEEDTPDDTKLPFSPDESSSERSEDEFAESFSRLQVGDDTFLSPDTESTGSTHSEDSSTKNKPRRKLNDFLVACKIEPLEKPWLNWQVSSGATRQRYTKKATEIVTAVLKTISPDSAGDLWHSLISSSAVNKALGLDELPQSEKLYLEALAEAYSNAASWDTRRQVLSIMSGVASSNVISMYIPGLTKYRYTIANLHRLQFGRGTPVPKQPTTRIRIDIKPLEHFISFITSPHLVQDLPFGQRHLKLSSGEVIDVPNLIRHMIPQRIVRQYTQYCQEINFKPFSERTMLRVLSECSASVRKSLQGLDYFAAEGARAFDDRVGMVHQMSENVAGGKEWEKRMTESLKASKLYLKGDLKVHISNSSQVADHCSVFSLSDSSDPDHRQHCDHSHEEICDMCHGLDATLTEIEHAVNEAAFPTAADKDEAIYQMKPSAV